MSDKQNSNWLLAKLREENVIKDDDEIDSDVLDESGDEEESDMGENNWKKIPFDTHALDQGHSLAGIPTHASRAYGNFHGNMVDAIDEGEARQSDDKDGEDNDENDDVIDENIDGDDVDSQYLAEQEEYRRFLQSIWLDDDECELDDEDEDYTYPERKSKNPGEASVDGDYSEAGGMGDEDEDDLQLETDVMKVRRKELQGLVNDCWLTIAGVGLGDNGLNTEIDGEDENDEDNQEVPHDDHQRQQKQRMLEQMHMSSKHTSFSPTILSNIISHLVHGGEAEGTGDLSTLCIDNLPLYAIKRIVARQMTMALQICLYVMLQVDSRSSLYTLCYHNLVELSNHREKSMKKIMLMQQHISILQRVKHSMGIGGLDLGIGVGHTQTNQEEKQNSTRYTRSSLSHTQSHTSSSLFDIPFLIPYYSNLYTLLSHIDQLKQPVLAYMRTHLHPLLYTHTQTYPHHQALTSLLACHKQTYLSMLINQMQVLYNTHSQVHTQQHSPLWHSLLPTIAYPLPHYQSYIVELNPAGLKGRHFFTPMESELLLRGLITLGEKWTDIKALFLPSKDIPLLPYTYTQKISSSYSNNSFKTYIRIKTEETSKTSADVFTLLEYIYLLRGYMHLGPNFTHIKGVDTWRSEWLGVGVGQMKELVWDAVNKGLVVEELGNTSADVVSIAESDDNDSMEDEHANVLDFLLDTHTSTSAQPILPENDQYSHFLHARLTHPLTTQSATSAYPSSHYPAYYPPPLPHAHAPPSVHPLTLPLYNHAHPLSHHPHAHTSTYTPYTNAPLPFPPGSLFDLPYKASVEVASSLPPARKRASVGMDRNVNVAVSLDNKNAGGGIGVGGVGEGNKKPRTEQTPTVPASIPITAPKPNPNPPIAGASVLNPASSLFLPDFSLSNFSRLVAHLGEGPTSSHGDNDMQGLFAKVVGENK
eukprot:gene22955-27935_t